MWSDDINLCRKRYEVQQLCTLLPFCLIGWFAACGAYKLCTTQRYQRTFRRADRSRKIGRHRADNQTRLGRRVARAANMVCAPRQFVGEDLQFAVNKQAKKSF